MDRQSSSDTNTAFPCFPVISTGSCPPCKRSMSAYNVARAFVMETAVMLIWYAFAYAFTSMRLLTPGGTTMPKRIYYGTYDLSLPRHYHARKRSYVYRTCPHIAGMSYAGEVITDTS